MMGFRWGSGERWYYQAQGPELQFLGAWRGTSNAKNYLRDMVVLKTTPPEHVVWAQNVEMETPELRDSEMDVVLCLSGMKPMCLF